MSLLPTIALKWAYSLHLVHKEEAASWLRWGETQLLIASQWASIRSYAAALEDLGWFMKICVVMAVIAIHGNSEQWGENNTLLDLVPKTSSFCFLPPKSTHLLACVQSKAELFTFSSCKEDNKKETNSGRHQSRHHSLSFCNGMVDGLGQKPGPHSTLLYIWYPSRQFSSAK